MGLETDWNCAISLSERGGPREILKDTDHKTNDIHGTDSYETVWDEKAKLPHGIKEIKKHLEETDNVRM